MKGVGLGAGSHGDGAAAGGVGRCEGVDAEMRTFPGGEVGSCPLALRLQRRALGVSAESRGARNAASWSPGVWSWLQASPSLPRWSYVLSVFPSFSG